MAGAVAVGRPGASGGVGARGARGAGRRVVATVLTGTGMSLRIGDGTRLAAPSVFSSQASHYWVRPHTHLSGLGASTGGEGEPQRYQQIGASMRLN